MINGNWLPRVGWEDEREREIVGNQKCVTFNGDSTIVRPINVEPVLTEQSVFWDKPEFEFTCRISPFLSLSNSQT